MFVSFWETSGCWTSSNLISFTPLRTSDQVVIVRQTGDKHWSFGYVYLMSHDWHTIMCQSFLLSQGGVEIIEGPGPKYFPSTYNFSGRDGWQSSWSRHKSSFKVSPVCTSTKIIGRKSTVGLHELQRQICERLTLPERKRSEYTHCRRRDNGMRTPCE